MSRRAITVVGQAVLACMAAAQIAAAQSVSRSDAPLKDLSLEELMDIDIGGVLRRNDPLFEAPAAVDVIYADEIIRSGAPTLADVLRLGAGVFVGQRDGRTWAVTTRGFSTSGNKLLVLVDGRSIYTPLFSGVFWDVQDLVLADIERIEIIRGPGATLWGANAVNGVINIITKPAAQTRDWLAQLTVGAEQRAIGVMRYGDELGESAHYRVYAKYRTFDALATADGMSAGDPLRSGQIGGRLDWDVSPRSRVSLSGDAYVGEAGLAGQPDIDLNGMNLLGRWTTRFEHAGELQIQGYYDRTYRQIPLQFEETRGTWDADLQYRLPRRGRHLPLIGGSYRLSRDETTPSETVRFVPSARNAPQFSVFAQDEIVIRPDRVDLIVGARLEDSDFSGVEFEPTIRARWKPRARHVAWAALSRAVRLPTRLESDVELRNPASPLVFLGSPDFLSEKLLAYEGGYRLQPHTRVAVDVSAFHNSYNDIRSLESETPTTFVLKNLVYGRSNGIEVQVNARPKTWLHLDAALTTFTRELKRRPGSNDPQPQREANDPGRMFQLRGAIDLPRNVDIHAFLWHIGPLPDPAVDGYTELNLRARWRVTPDLSLAVGGRNLLNDRHPEFGGPQVRSELERSVSASFSLVF